jgi:hypothetical protein
LRREEFGLGIENEIQRMHAGKKLRALEATYTAEEINAIDVSKLLKIA